MFRYLLRLDVGKTREPQVFVTVPHRKVGETFMINPRVSFRILAIETEIDAELEERGFHGIFIEPV